MVLIRTYLRVSKRNLYCWRMAGQIWLIPSAYGDVMELVPSTPDVIMRGRMFLNHSL